MTATTTKLTQDLDLPLVGFGTFLIPDDQAADVVESALRIGYRHVDTAEIYQNEAGVGEGLRRAFATGLAREDVVVTTKLWPQEADGSLKTTSAAVRSLDESLERLGLDHVDLYLIHAPFDAASRLAQWEALVETLASGKARAIGVSNFGVKHLEELAAAGLPTPHANQIELHPWSQKPDLVSYLRSHDITPIAYSSLVPLSTWREAPDHPSGKTEAMQSDSVRSDSVFKTLAAKYGVSEAQLLLRWGVQSGYAVLPKSTKTDRMLENFDLFSFEIGDSDMSTLAALDRGQGVAWGEDDPTHTA